MRAFAVCIIVGVDEPTEDAALVRLRGEHVLDELAALHRMAPRASLHVTELETDDGDRREWSTVQWHFRPAWAGKGPFTQR